MVIIINGKGQWFLGQLALNIISSPLFETGTNITQGIRVSDKSLHDRTLLSAGVAKQSSTICQFVTMETTERPPFLLEEPFYMACTSCSAQVQCFALTI